MHIKIHSRFPSCYVDEDQVPVFCGTAYTKFLTEVKSENITWFIGFKDDVASCLIPFSIKKRLIFKKGYFLTAVINLVETDKETEKEFLELIVSYIKEKRICDWIEQPPNWAIFNAVPSNSIYCKFGSYIIDMRCKNETEILAGFQGRNRQSISRAIRDGVEIKKGVEYLDDSIKILTEITNREGVKHPHKKELSKLFDILKNRILIYTAFLDGIPQATGILLHNGYSSYGIYGGSSKSAVRGAYPLLCWEAIKESNEKGVKFFDFVGARVNPAPGSKLERIQQYKQHFGAEMFQGYLWKMPISKIKYKIYKFLVDVYFLIRFKKYKGDIIDQELNCGYNENIRIETEYRLFLGKREKIVKLLDNSLNAGT